MVDMGGKTAFIAIFIAQVFVMATLHIVRNRGLWKSRRSAGLAVFGLEVGYVFISLIIADWIS